MKICVLDIVKKQFALLLVLLVGLLVLNSTLYMHIHRLPNGNLVVHAHPFSKSAKTENPAQQHQHSKVELLVFDSLLLLFAFGVSTFVCFVLSGTYISKFAYKYSLRENIPLLLTNKAPPNFSFQ